MERMKVAEKSSDMFILNCLMLLLSATIASAVDSEETSGSGRPVWNIDQGTEDRFHWNEDSLEVKVGSNLTLSCLVDALDLQYELFRISLIQGDILFPVVENGLVHSPFSSIQRYSATMNEDRSNGGARMTIHVEDVQPEDAGTYICNKYMEGDNSAVLNVTVLVPISDLYITSMDPDGEEMRMDAESEVFLQEHDFYGVGCIATVEGSQTSPQLRVEIDGKDETESFQTIHQVDYTILQSGLAVWNSHLRLAYVSATPNPDYNEKLMRCVASQTGFPDVEATTRLLVQFAPLINCVPERLVARQGTSATLDCNIRANPGSRITWSSARGDLSNYPNVFFDETVISSDETRLRLSIRNIQLINFQRYTLTAANIVASSQSTFELVEDETVAVGMQPKVERFPPEEDSILPEMVEEVFPYGDDFPAMDADWFAEKTSFARESSSTIQEASSTMLETSSSPVVEEKQTLAPSISTSPDIQSTVQDVDVIFPDATVPDVKSTVENVGSALPDVKSTLSDITSTLLDVKSTLQDVDSIFRDVTLADVKSSDQNVGSALPDVKSTLPDVKSTLSSVKNMSPDVKNILQNVDSTLPLSKSTSADVKSTTPSVKNILPDVKNILQNVDSTLPLSRSTSQYVKRTLPPVIKNPLPRIKTTTIDVGFNLPDPATSLTSTRSPSPSGRAHPSPGRARSAHHKGTSNPLKTSRDALPATAATVLTKAPKTTVALSSEEELEQPLPAAAGEVHYSLSRSSSSSSSKKDSGKSGKENKSTSGAAAISLVQYLLASLLLIRWF